MHSRDDSGQRATPHRGERGITLIELVITLGVVGLLFTVMGSGLARFNKTQLRDETIRIAATLKAAFNMATLSGVHHRVVFDLEKQNYRIEACPGNPALYRTDVEDVLPDPKALERLAEDVERKAQQTTAANRLADVTAASSPEKASRRRRLSKGSTSEPLSAPLR